MQNFNSIAAVPTGSSLVDDLLSSSNTQQPKPAKSGDDDANAATASTTPTIEQIRSFYVCKVKSTQKTLSEKFDRVLTDFPDLDSLHPFYSDLINVLNDRDHLKVALAEVRATRETIEALGSDYVRLIKYGDSLYRCKQLKRAALGRMATACKKLNSNLEFLEQVRQHLARLPSIDPNGRSLIMCGFPNVGKSSFMNKVTRADVEVQPYAFTTKSLFVGHTDYKYADWQVIDTPGILDHSLEERNVIEMQAITALAHLRACILFFMDLSGQCGYSIETQLGLFRSISPLFAGKPLVVVLNKSDVCTLDDVSNEERANIHSAMESVDAKYISISMMDDSCNDLKSMACDLLLDHRAALKETGRIVANIQPASLQVDLQPKVSKSEAATTEKVEREGKEEDRSAHLVEDSSRDDDIDPEIAARLEELEKQADDDESALVAGLEAIQVSEK